MALQGLDGKFYRIKYTKDNSDRKTSELHKKAKSIIKKVFRFSFLAEEVPVNIFKDKILYLDFYLPSVGVLVEVHGKQHYEYCHHFHGSKFNFVKAKENDKLKIKWAKLNGIIYVELSYNESELEWEGKIRAAHEELSR